MPRNTFLLILAILVSMLGFWYFKSSAPNQGSAPERTLRLTETALPLVPASVPERKPALDRKEILRTQTENEILNLEAQLAQGMQKLETEKQVLEQLRQHYQNVMGTASYRSQINSRDLEIKNLIDMLGDYHQAEEDLNRAAAINFRDQDSAARVARDQLEIDIQNLEQLIHNSQNELNYWQNFPAGLDITNQKSEIERLQNQLAQQRSELNSLRIQRVNISAQVLNSSQSMELLAERARAELRRSADETQEQIFSLRSEIDRLQRVQNQSQNQLGVLGVQIARAEKDLEEQSRNLNSIQEAIRVKKASLHLE